MKMNRVKQVIGGIVAVLLCAAMANAVPNWFSTPK